MIVKFTATTTPPGKLAEAELHFTERPLAGLKLIGFAIWERRGAPTYNVTFPARQYSINGERRSFALLRPADGDSHAAENIRETILDAFTHWKKAQDAGEDTESNAQ